MAQNPSFYITIASTLVLVGVARAIYVLCHIMCKRHTYIYIYKMPKIVNVSQDQKLHALLTGWNLNDNRCIKPSKCCI